MSGDEPTDAGRDADTPATMAAAVAEVRREGVKAAAVHALVEASLLALVANLLIAVGDVGLLDRGVLGASGESPVTVGTVVTAAVGLLALGIGLARRLRRPAVERFEAVNPSVAEALRTARDTVEDGEDTPIARALYADVLERLRGTSSRRLLGMRRLAVSIALVMLVSLLTVQASLLGVSVGDAGLPGIGGTPDGGGGGPGGDGDGAVDEVPGDGGQGAGSDVLGDPEDVTAGSEEIPVAVEVGGTTGDDGAGEVYVGDAASGTGAVDPELAGYAPQPELEDADVIREYNLRIREGGNG